MHLIRKELMLNMMTHFEDMPRSVMFIEIVQLELSRIPVSLRHVILRYMDNLQISLA